MPPPEDPRSLEDLLDAAGRSVQPTAFGWQSLSARLARTAQRPPLTLQRWATLPLGIAAAATLLLVLWLGPDRGDQARAGPIQANSRSPPSQLAKVSRPMAPMCQISTIIAVSVS